MLSLVPVDVSRTSFPCSVVVLLTSPTRPHPLNGIFLASLRVFNPNSPVFLHPRADLGKALQPPLQIQNIYSFKGFCSTPQLSSLGNATALPLQGVSGLLFFQRAEKWEFSDRNLVIWDNPIHLCRLDSWCAARLAAPCQAAKGLLLPFLLKLPGVCSLSIPPIWSFTRSVPFISWWQGDPGVLEPLQMQQDSRMGLGMGPTSAGVSLSALASLPRCTHTGKHPWPGGGLLPLGIPFSPCSHLVCA